MLWVCSAKKVCNRCIEVCKHCTLFWTAGLFSLNIAAKTQRPMSEKRVRITNDRLNSYGCRVLTAGMNTEQYSRNPVLLYMHERGNVIGYVRNLQVQAGELTGELVFDEASELSVRCKKQYEFGSLRMVSAGLDILELSDSPEHLLPGQTRPTITKSKLFEVSLVDIGANDDAIVLRHEGNPITFGSGSCHLPLLNNQPKTRKSMDQKTLALQLGLPETADWAAIGAKIAELKAAKANEEKLREEIERLHLSRITSAVEKAIAEKRIGPDKKQQFVELGKKVGADDLEKTFEAMNPQVKLSAVIHPQSGAATTYSKLSDVPEDKLIELRENNREEYKRLYRAEYGMECEI